MTDTEPEPDTDLEAAADAAAALLPVGLRRRGLNSEQRRWQRREALMEAALEHFGTKGYHASTVEELCKTARVSTRSFYEEFENREAVLLATNDRIARRIFTALSQYERDPTKHTLRGREAARFEITERVSVIVHELVDDPRVARLAFVESIGISPEQETRRQDAVRGFARYMESASGLAPPPDRAARKRLDAIELGLVSGLYNMLSNWALTHTVGDAVRSVDGESVDEVIELMTELYLMVYGHLAGWWPDA